MISFIESNMTFSFPETNLYRIEKDKIANKAKGFSVCECVVLTGGKKISFIEAKSSAPNPDGEKGKERFTEFLEEITQKFKDSLSIYHAVLSRHNGEGMPTKFKKIALKDADFKLYLIILGHKDEWLVRLNDSLKSQMKGVLHLWNIRDINVKVLNEKLAKERGLITDFTSKEQ